MARGYIIPPTAGQIAAYGGRGYGRPGSSVAKPMNITLPTISGTCVVGQTLSTTNGTWTGSPTSYSYQWRRGGVNIGGATSSAYTVVAADCANVAVDCVVTAMNAGGSTSQASSNTLAFSFALLTSIRGYYDANSRSAPGGVETATDLSGNSQNLAAPAAGNSPTFNATDAAFNNQPSWTFNGSSQYMRRTSFSFGTASPTDITKILVFKETSVTLNQRFSDYNNQITLRSGTSDALIAVVGTATTVGPTIGTSAAHVAIIRRDSTDQILRFDGVDSSPPTTAVGSLTSGNTLELGAAFNSTAPAACKVAAFAVMAARISANEIASVNAYCTARWGLTA